MSIETDRVDPLVLRTNKLDLLERLADSLAHEIKNPLHSMVINLEVLKRRIARCEAGETDDMLRYVGVLSGELERVNQRVELLLRLARPTRQGNSTTLGALVEELLDILALEAEKRSIQISYAPTVDLARVEVSRDPFQQVVLNLVLAALDGLSAGDTLRISSGQADSRVQLVVCELPCNEAAADPVEGAGSNGPLPESDEFLAVRALGESVGGRLERQREPDGRLLWVFSLPTPRG